jgi:hypothetical protein
MQAPSHATLIWLVLTPLLMWRIYARIRRLVGRQRLSRIRLWITMTIFPLLVCLYVFSARAHVDLLAWLVAAIVVGFALANYGLRRTRFEPTLQGLFYTPNAHLGIALSLLFVARVVSRLVEIFVLSSGAAPGDWSGFAHSPVTLAVFGLLSGYYVGYAIGLLRWRARVIRVKRARAAATSATAPRAPPAH